MSANTTTSPAYAEELDRLEILRSYKQLFAGAGGNRSPFGDHSVLRYDTAVEAWDVPEIHLKVREAIRECLAEVHARQMSRVVIFAGDPGMGKTHLLNHFRDPKLQETSNYVMVGNSNHWNVEEFESCLLTWMVAALTRPNVQGPNLLLSKLEDVAFQALDQILDQPGKIRDFLGGRAGWLRRLWWTLGPDQHARFRQAIQDRDVRVFRRLDFHRFASFVCDRFLYDRTNPFHRFVLHVLLRYLFPEDRPLVLGWLVGQRVQHGFHESLGSPYGARDDEPADPAWPKPEQQEAKLLQTLGVADRLDCNYKVIDTLKILVSLFAADVNKDASGRGTGTQRVFFFAFDQTEGRNELFQSEADWFKFFAKLSELYNTLPNVLVVFTMTLGLRNHLYPKMERQFQQRIHRDQKFVLESIEDEEVLAVYRRHMEVWRQGKLSDVEPLQQNPKFHFLPFTQPAVLEMSRRKSLREMLEKFDHEFRRSMMAVASKDAREDFLVALNEFKEEEKKDNAFRYTEDHLQVVKKLLQSIGGRLADAMGLVFVGVEECATENNQPALRLELRHGGADDRWVRIFVAWLPRQYRQRVEKYFDLLYYKQTDRYFLWLLRPERIDEEVETRKTGQIVARVLHTDTHTRLRAVQHVIDKMEETTSVPDLPDDDRDKYRHVSDEIAVEEFKLSYLGEMFRRASEALEAQQKGGSHGAE